MNPSVRQSLVREAPFVGELLYSVRAREQVQLGLPSGAHLHAYQTAGRRRVYLAAPIPRDLSVFDGYRADHPLGDPGRILEQFTTLPYFTRFRRDRLDLVQSIGATALSGVPTAAWSRLGLPRYPVPAFPEAARWCPKCIEEDRERDGVWVEYWHREHQLPGVEHCLHHRCPLLAWCENCAFGLHSTRRSLLLVGQCFCDETRAEWLSARDSTPMCTDAWMRFARLSAECLEQPDLLVPNELGRRTRNLLAEHGFGTPSQLKLEKLADAIQRRFDGDLVRRLLPVQDVEQYLVRRMRRIAGPTADRQPTVLWILLVGTLFESVAEFQAAVASAETRSDAKTPVAVLAPWQAEKLEMHQQAILEYIAVHPTATRESVRLAMPGAHSYLQRKDRTWLRDYLPRRKTAKTGRRGIRVDDRALDRAWAKSLEQAFDALLAVEGRPVRATALAAVGEAGIGKSRFWRLRERLPRCNAVIERRQEAQISHQRRCLLWGLQQLRMQGTPLSTIALRHAARLPERVILEHAALVLAEARRLKMARRMPNWSRLATGAEAPIARRRGPHGSQESSAAANGEAA